MGQCDERHLRTALLVAFLLLVTRNSRDIARMELKFPELRVVSPEDFLKEIES